LKLTSVCIAERARRRSGERSEHMNSSGRSSSIHAELKEDQ
jgi:hypothetical protein